MLNLKQLQYVEDGTEQIRAIYEVTHNNGKTTLHDIEVKVFVDDKSLKRTDGQGNVLAIMEIKDCRGNSIDEALEKLASWCERSALGIRERGDVDRSLSFVYKNTVEPEYPVVDEDLKGNENNNSTFFREDY